MNLNVWLKLGLAGFAVGVICTILCAVLLMSGKNVRRRWLLAVCVLFSSSFIVCAMGQVEIVSKVSAGGTDE